MSPVKREFILYLGELDFRKFKMNYRITCKTMCLPYA